MAEAYLELRRSAGLQGSVPLSGAKNAALVSMASLLLTDGISCLRNVPVSADVLCMIQLLQELGAQVMFDHASHTMTVDTRGVNRWAVSAAVMRKMRASVLVMGPLLARFGRADITVPGGCVIGTRPIDYHLANFERMGAEIVQQGTCVRAKATQLQAKRLVLEYPSVGATENLLMAATITPGRTEIVNASLEPELLDLICLLRKMGAVIDVAIPATIVIEGQQALSPVDDHAVMMDRLEAGSLLLAAAITGGTVTLPDAHADELDIFLFKLEEMGHSISVGEERRGITLRATKEPRAVSFKTHPYPGFPTDLQAPMMAAQCFAEGTSVVEETVYENRFLHARELAKMGAQIKIDGRRAMITGVDTLYAAPVIATDVRASCALVLAGLVADGVTMMTGLHHWRRGYDALEHKLQILGASITVCGASEQAATYSHDVAMHEEISQE